MGNQSFSERLRPVDGGGVTSAAGFAAAGVSAGLRPEPDRLDLALVLADQPCAAAGVFTANRFCAAPVRVSREHLDGRGFGQARCVLINSGNANAATGEEGLVAARSTCETMAQALGCTPTEVLVASTGVIGQLLDIAPFAPGIAAALNQASAQGGADAARAIMTTDTCPKECAFSYESAVPEYAGGTFTVGGMAKGAGMIMPNMATMIAVVTTDAPVAPQALHHLISEVAGLTFNKVTIDSDTSTNDTCFMLASGAAAPDAPVIKEGTPAFEELVQATRAVCEYLARAIASDGEGASRLITVTVCGAADAAQADCAARAVANSPLVKTAVAGHDCNWGRVAMALGKSGAEFCQEKVAIDIMGIPVCRDGLTVPFDEDEAQSRFAASEIVIEADLGAGSASATVWTCDLTHEYVTINGEYRT